MRTASGTDAWPHEAAHLLGDELPLVTGSAADAPLLAVGESVFVLVRDGHLPPRDPDDLPVATLLGALMERDWSVPSLVDATRTWAQAVPFAHATYRVVSAADSSGIVEGRDALDVARERSTAVAAVVDLRDWLSLSLAEVCRMTGVSESTFWHWVKHPDTKPRLSTVDLLMSTWSLAGLVHEMLGASGASQWWHHGRPSRLQQLREQGEHALHDLADEVATLTGAYDEVEPPDVAVDGAQAAAMLRAMLSDSNVS